MLYYGSHISEHLVKTPEQYLICYSVPINRTGPQIYLAKELQLDGDPDREVKVYRLEEDVFSPAALASFEGKDITRDHPPEMLSAENQANYSKGHLENVRRSGENTVADLVIKDAALASDVENGIVREISCGYYCDFEPYLDGYKQTKIRGNHVAVVSKGRAGKTVSIKDAADEAEKGLKKMKKETKEALYRFFGMAANDAQPEELEQLTKDVAIVATALDAEPAEKAPEAEPAEDEMVEKAPKGDDLGSKLDLIIEMLRAKSRGGEGERRLHDEGDIDEEIKRLIGKEEEGESVTIPVENEDCMTDAAKDAAVALLKKVRPAVASIEDRNARARVTDALLSAIKSEDKINVIAKAATDSAKLAAKTNKTNYETMCADSEKAYASRNPHKKED